MREMIGLDIGSHSIKLVGLRMTSKGPFLTRLGIREIPYSKERMKEVSEILKEMLEKLNIGTKKVRMTLSGPGTFIRRIVIPSIPKSELKEAISWEMKAQLPCPLETLQLAFYILREFIEDEVKKLEILTVACPKERIEYALNIAREAGLQPMHIEVTPISLWNLLVSLSHLKKEEVVAVADLGAEKTNLYLFEERGLVFHREITPGGKDITQILLDEIPTLNYEQGEKVKREIGISVRKTPVDSQVPAKESYIMRPLFERLVGEIGRSIEFYRNQFVVEKVDKIILSGGGAHLKNIIPYFEEELRMKVEIFNPLEAFFYDPKRIDPSLLSMGAIFGPAVGVTLFRPIQIEFLSLKEPFFSKVQWSKRIPMLAFSAAALFILILVLHTEVQLSQLEQAKNERLEKIKNLESIKSTLLLLKQKEAKMREEQSLFFFWADSSKPYREVLKVIGELIPDNMTLNLLEIQTEAASSQKDSSKTSPAFLHLSGWVFGNDAQSLLTLAQLIERLEGSHYFSRVKLISVQEDKTFYQKASTFEILCEFSPQTLKREEH